LFFHFHARHTFTHLAAKLKIEITARLSLNRGFGWINLRLYAGGGGPERRGAGSVYLWSDLKGRQRPQNDLYEVE